MKTKITVISVLLVLVALFVFGCWNSPIVLPPKPESLPPKLIERTGQGLSSSQDLPLTKASANADQLAAAILTPGTAPLLMSASMSGVAAQFEVYTASLQGFPTDGSSYTLISNGNASGIAGAATTFYDYYTGGPNSPPYSHRGYFSYDIATLSLNLSVPAGATTLSFDWKFGTEENPTYIGSFVDWASAIVTTSDGSTNILLLPDGKPVDVDNAIPFSNAVTGSSDSPSPPYPSPDDTVYNAVTGMYTSTFNVAPFVGETIRIDFWVGDENDQALDSALFIDNLNIGPIIKIVHEKIVEAFYDVPFWSPPWPVFGRMTVSYEWSDHRDGEDVYTISEIHLQAAGFVGLAAFSIWDTHSGAEPERVWNDELTLAPIWDMYQATEKTIVFVDSIEVYASDTMSAQITGWGGTLTILALTFVANQGLQGTSLYAESRLNFEPGSTETPPEVPHTPIDVNDLYLAHVASPTELRVYDSTGNMTGLIDGGVRVEIAHSAYIDSTVIIFSPPHSYRYQVVGKDEGIYSLNMALVEDGQDSTFAATDIPVVSGAVHQYTIDWHVLSLGGEGVTIQIDFDGDGTFELTITTGSIFIFIPATIDIDPDTLNLKSKIKWINAYIELLGGYDVADIDVGTVKLWYEGNSVPAEWGDIQDSTLMVKFNGKAVQDLFTGPVDAATVAVSGELQDGTPFGGNDTIRVIKKP